MPKDATLHWPLGQVTMQQRGAMLRGLQIQLPDGRLAEPLHTAPWVSTAEAETQQGLMRGLSGEWPCVPFGVPHDNLPSHWHAPIEWEDPFSHGYGAHHDWELTLTKDALEAEIILPSEHPIHSLKRRVRPVGNGISMDLWVYPRRDCCLPIGLHPVFALPEKSGQMKLEVSGAQSIWSHPETPTVDPTPAHPGAVSESLAAIQGVEGQSLDFSRLPRAENSETRLLVTGGDGQVSLTNTETGVRTILHYNSDQFPFVMLWVSNRGRTAPPWSSRHLALGVEPVRAAFDLGTTVSAADNPLSALGDKTAFDLKADEPFHTSYAIKALLLRTE